jgi:hypothetical protein
MSATDVRRFGIIQLQVGIGCSTFLRTNILSKIAVRKLVKYAKNISRSIFTNGKSFCTYVFLRKRGWQDMNLVIPDEHVDRVALEVDSLQEFHD